MSTNMMHSGGELPFRIFFTVLLLMISMALFMPEIEALANGNPWNEGGGHQEASISEDDQKKMNKYARKVNSVIGDILKDFYVVLQGAGAVLLIIYFMEFGISINASEPPNRYIKGIAAALLFLIAPTILAALV